MSLNFADLSGADLSRSNLRQTELIGAKLVKTNLNNANLSNVRLIEANLSGASLNKVDLSGADLNKSNLSRVNIRQADLSGADLISSDFSGADLSEANLTGSNFSGAYLVGVNLIRANLTGAYLIWTDLSGARVIEANMTSAIITGACLFGIARDDWIIDGIKCDYIFWDSDKRKRIPKEGSFEDGEFEKKYKQLPTFEYLFEKGCTPFDTIIIDYIVQDIRNKYRDFHLQVDNIHFRTNPRVVFTVSLLDYIEKASRLVKEKYEVILKKIRSERDELRGERNVYHPLFKDNIQKHLIKSMKDNYNINAKQVIGLGSNPNVHDVKIRSEFGGEAK